MALSFLVGGAINDLKKNTTGSDAKNIVGGLEDPKQFVHKMARSNINDAVMEARMDLQRRMGGQTPQAQQQPPQAQQAPQPPPQAPQPPPQAPVASLSETSVSQLCEKLEHTNKVLEDMAISLNGILKLLVSKQISELEHTEDVSPPETENDHD